MADNKIKVETTGNFMLLDPTNGASIEAFGETEVEPTSFVAQMIIKGKLKQTGGAKLDTKNAPPLGADPMPLRESSDVAEPLRTDTARRQANEEEAAPRKGK